MEGLLAAGIGGLMISGIGFLHSWTSGKPYVDKLKTAQAIDVTHSSPSFVFLSGPLVSDTAIERGGQKYAAVIDRLYELSVVRKLYENDTTRYAEYAPHKLFLSSNFVFNKTKIGGWDVNLFLDAFTMSNAGEVFDPIVTSGNPFTATINVGNKGKTPLGETERQLSGRLTVSEGVKIGDYYTIFGNTPSYHSIVPCHEYGMLVFQNRSASQVISEAEQSLSFHNWIFGAIGCAR